jgi:putative hydrolase of the HAD superfamily
VRNAPLKAVLLDVGNTLLHLDYRWIADACRARGREVDAAQVQVAEYGAKAAIDRVFAGRAANVEVFWPDAVRRHSYFALVLAELGFSAEEADLVVDALEEENRAGSLWRVAEADTLAVLASLRGRGFALAAVSNADGRVEASLVRHGLRASLDLVIDSHVVGIEKPDPRIFAIALERLGVPAEAAVHVGDIASIDVVGARRAGVRPVLIDPLDRYPTAVDCPRVRRLAELLDLLPEQPSAPVRD